MFESRLSAHSRAAARASSIVRSTPTLPQTASAPATLPQPEQYHKFPPKGCTGRYRPIFSCTGGRVTPSARIRS